MALEVMASYGAGYKQGAVAKAWLAQLTSEQLLQLAMMADGSDTAFVLLRFVDDPRQDVSLLNKEIYHCLNNLTHLFGTEEACLCTPGYTETMLAALSRERSWCVGGKMNTVGSRGGVSRSTRVNCLSRMRAWTDIVREIVQTEFPHYHIIQAGGGQ
eukprot:NODE_5510_length_576_cov_2.285988.p1 GENE.NODE_5510_length_576_cov_2.285988~~NODE_5510_length_576_cov_2.285988.p1  ORF type:complete len:184 (-),score=16.67 NODE_5510_length_576_cov_2.285988:24-494(-)